MMRIASGLVMIAAVAAACGSQPRAGVRGDRDWLAAAAQVRGYMTARAEVSGGYWLEREGGRYARLVAAVTRDRSLHAAALRELVDVPIRVVAVTRTQAELRALQNRIADDRAALAARDLHWVSVGTDVTKNRVDVELWTKRHDAHDALRGRYGDAVHAEVIADVPYRVRAIKADGVRGRGRELVLQWSGSSSQRTQCLDVRETDATVTVQVRIRNPVGPQTSDLVAHAAVVTLDRSLSRRKVVDASTGRSLRRLHARAGPETRERACRARSPQ